MSADKTLLDPWRPMEDAWTEEVIAPCAKPQGRSVRRGRPMPRADVVPPVRTIVLDRQPAPVAPAA